MNANKNNLAIPSTNMEPASSHEPMAEEEGQGLDTRFNVTITSYRKRKHDPDGISCKAALDGLVRAGLLPDDSTSEIKSITFKSIICKKDEEEKTIIELDQF